MTRWLIGLAMVVLCACGGDEPRYRPLILDVQGLSGRATRLTVMAFTGETAPRCTDVVLETVQTFSSDNTQVWERDAGTERRLDFDGLVGEAITFIGYAQDGQGMPIQFACAQIEYTQIESPEQTVQLSMRQ